MSAKIMIVDDEKNVRLNYRLTLETEGYEVFEAASATNALDQLVERSFDSRYLICACLGWMGCSCWRECEKSELRSRR